MENFTVGFTPYTGQCGGAANFQNPSNNDRSSFTLAPRASARNRE